MATRRQLVLVRTLRRLTNQEIKILRRSLRRFVNSQKAKVINLVLESKWTDIDKIFEGLIIKIKPVIAMTYGNSINIVSRALGIKVAKAEEFEPEDLVELLGPEISFDIYNPRVISYIERHGLELSKTVVDGLKATCREALEEGYKLGESIPHLRRRLAETLEGFTKTRLEMIARSETMQASQKGAIEGYIQSGIVDKVRWLASVDERCCDICSELDGQEFTLSEVPALPHPDCRCTVVPII